MRKFGRVTVAVHPIVISLSAFCQCRLIRQNAHSIFGSSTAASNNGIRHVSLRNTRLVLNRHSHSSLLGRVSIKNVVRIPKTINSECMGNCYFITWTKIRPRKSVFIRSFKPILNAAASTRPSGHKD